MHLIREWLVLSSQKKTNYPKGCLGKNENKSHFYLGMQEI